MQSLGVYHAGVEVLKNIQPFFVNLNTVSKTPLSDEKEDIVGEGVGVISSNRKIDLVILFSGQRQTNTTFKPNIKINFNQRNIISSIY